MSQREAYFVDTNVILRFLLNDHAELTPQAYEFFRRFEASEFDIVISDSVIFEAVYVMEGRNYKVGREEIVEKLGKLLKTEGIARIGIVDFEKVFSLYVEIPQLAFADCSHAVWALEMPNQTIVSFDTDYSRVNGLTWLMPPHVPNQ